MQDKNGKEIMTGDIILIENGFFKHDNGHYIVTHSEGDAGWSGRGHALLKCNAAGKPSKQKYNHKILPLMAFTNSHFTRIRSRKHYKEFTTIEVVGHIENR